MQKSTAIEYTQTLDLSGERIEIKHAAIDAEEYIAFLGRTNLGHQYPKENFVQRICVLVSNVQISLIARNPNRTVVGVCFGLTDFAYWLFLTDLGVDRRYERRGLGKFLVEAAHELSGGEKAVVMFTNVNDEAVPFYEKLGLKPSADIYAKWNIDWTPFEVGKSDVK